MKALITVASCLFVGLQMVAANYSPIQEIHHFLENKRRILLTAISSAAGFVFIMAAILLGTVEAALQYDAQGFILWSPIFTAVTWFFGAGIFSCLVARLALPVKSVPAPVAFSLRELIKELRLSELIEKWLSPAAESRIPDASQNGKFDDFARPPKFTPVEEKLYSH